MQGQASRYLLSGLCECGVCGANMIGTYSRSHTKAKKHRKYSCSYRMKSGRHACSNALRIDNKEMDLLVLDAVRQALTAEQVETTIKAALQKIRERRHQHPDEAKQLKSEIGRLEGEIERLAQAIEQGGSTTLGVRVVEKERQTEVKRELLATLESAETVDLDQAKLRRELTTNLERFHELLGGKHVQQLRQVLARFLAGNKLTLVPHDDGKTWHIEGETILGPLFEGPRASKWCRERDPFKFDRMFLIPLLLMQLHYHAVQHKRPTPGRTNIGHTTPHQTRLTLVGT